MNGDGYADIIAGAGPGGGPNVRVFSGKDLAELGSFFAYSPAFTGGVNVAAGDVTGDGVPDIVTGAGESGGSHVRVFDGLTGQASAEWFASDTAVLGGARVAVGDVTGDGRADVIASVGVGVVPHVRVFDVVGSAPVADFVAFPTPLRGGVGVTSADLDDLAAGPT